MWILPPFIVLGLEAHRAISLGHTPYQGGISISIWSPLWENNLNLYVAVLLVIHSRSILMRAVLKWVNKIALLNGMLCEGNRDFLALSPQVL